VIVNEENAHDTSEFLNKRLTAIKNQRSTGEQEDLALIIGLMVFTLAFNLFLTLGADGKSLGFALDKSLSKVFLELAIMCKAVICCEFHCVG
jgi:phospholipid-transporting ATPase